MRRPLALVSVLASVATALGAPLTPTIIGHDFNFGAYNALDIEYATNGLKPDTLVYTQHALPDHEVTAYWPNWPAPPVYPVWDLADPPGFGGEFVLAVQFTGQDAPLGPLDVSLTGTGLNRGADLEIFGTIDFGGGDILAGRLWALDLEAVSLYGYADEDAYVLEGLGTIVGGLVPERYGLIGTPAGMRGQLDFVDRPPGWLPPLYNPVTDPLVEQVRAAYSGETGVIPEPATFSLLVAGLTVLTRRR